MIYIYIYTYIFIHICMHMHAFTYRYVRLYMYICNAETGINIMFLCYELWVGCYSCYIWSVYILVCSFFDWSCSIIFSFIPLSVIVLMILSGLFVCLFVVCLFVCLFVFFVCLHCICNCTSLQKHMSRAFVAISLAGYLPQPPSATSQWVLRSASEASQVNMYGVKNFTIWLFNIAMENHHVE